MLNSFEKIIKAMMVKDNTLDSYICETEAELKRDLTIEEENQYIKDITHECVMRAMDLSCSLKEAYEDIMY